MRQDGRFTASTDCSPPSIAAEKFGVEHRGQSFSGTRAVSCCFSTSLSPAPEQTDARFSQGEAAGGAAPAYRVILQWLQQDWRLSRSARRSRRVDRCGPPTRPRVEWSRLGSIAARSAVRRPRLPPLLRPRLGWALAGPPGSRAGSLASCSARPGDRGRSACRVRVARSRGGLWRAVCAHWALSWSV